MRECICSESHHRNGGRNGFLLNHGGYTVYEISISIVRGEMQMEYDTMEWHYGQAVITYLLLIN